MEERKKPKPKINPTKRQNLSSKLFFVIHNIKKKLTNTILKKFHWRTARDTITLFDFLMYSQHVVSYVKDWSSTEVVYKASKPL